jgi:hypothetical protein
VEFRLTALKRVNAQGTEDLEIPDTLGAKLALCEVPPMEGLATRVRQLVTERKLEPHGPAPFEGDVIHLLQGVSLRQMD